ncbi:hypothetical protein LTR15_007215 [Elasticomyces elasticus]|nr:hypothetical protein LTR15_007215 [Elasticomyces elasticus]
MSGPMSRAVILPPTGHRREAASRKKAKISASPDTTVPVSPFAGPVPLTPYTAPPKQQETPDTPVGIDAAAYYASLSNSVRATGAFEAVQARSAELEERIKQLEAQKIEDLFKFRDLERLVAQVPGAQQVRARIPVFEDQFDFDQEGIAKDNGLRLASFSPRGPRRNGRKTDIVVMARESGAHSDPVQTRASLYAGNVAVGLRVAGLLGDAVGTVYTCERITRSNDGILCVPVNGNRNEDEVKLFWTLDDIRRSGNECLIVQRGYDGISSVLSTKLWMMFHHLRGLQFEFMTYQKKHERNVALHHYVLVVMLASHAMKGRISPVETVQDMYTNTPTADVAAFWDLVDRICTGKLLHNYGWYNRSRNDY